MRMGHRGWCEPNNSGANKSVHSGGKPGLLYFVIAIMGGKRGEKRRQRGFCFALVGAEMNLDSHM